jgi:hypothetical protein
MCSGRLTLPATSETMLVHKKNHLEKKQPNEQKVEKNENDFGRITNEGPPLSSSISIEDQLDHFASIIVNNIIQELKRYEKNK